MTLKEAQIPDETGLIILALRNRGEGELKFNPSSEEILEEGDIMLVLGKSQQIDKLKEIALDERSLL